jgi:uncharacterized protein involved in outer membrane biogenesis
MSKSPEPQPSRLGALREKARSWSARQWRRTRAGASTAWRHARTGADWTWRKLAIAPWKRIGLWAGGAVGTLFAALILFLLFADWNALRGPIARIASNMTGREIVIAGNLDVDPWSWTPKVHVENLRIGNLPHYRDRGQFAEIGEADMAFRLLPLFIGRFEIVRIALDNANVSLYRNAEGVSNWSDPNRASRPFDLPAIREFSLTNGTLRFEDEKRSLLLNAAFNTSERLDPQNPGEFSLSGEGEINNRPFTIELTGAPLLNVRRDRPYPFVADVRAGGTRLKADGSINRPFNFSRWQADIEVSGPDLADLYPLTGLALPNTPPYRVAGLLERNQAAYGMERVSGRVGDSDIAGRFLARTQDDDRIFFDGEFRSNSLDFDDLLAIFGGAPDTGETASAEQRAVAAALASQGRLLPDASLDISRVRNMDARVSYRAARVRSERLPLRGLELNVSLDHGLLRLDPMTLELVQGRIGGAASINARQDLPRVDVDVRLTNARLESMFRLASGKQPLTGELVGRVRLTGRGLSVRDAAANAHGDLTLVTPRGEVREAFAELTGINVARGLGLLLSGDQSKTDVRCAVASFRVTNGIARSRTIVFDTSDMLITGSGTVNLRNETFDLEIEGEPKEPRLLRVAAPISIEGRWRAPEVGVEIEDAVDQGGLAAALASLVAPIAAVLPFVDPGLAEHTDCGALLAGANGAARAG